MRRVLHLLSQRPLQTGSGVTLTELVRHARAAGWEQRVVVGSPATDPAPVVADLPQEHVLPLLFETKWLKFPVPGMSDVMPYPSTRFSSMSQMSLKRYLHAWRSHLTRVVGTFEPQVVHAHHVWLVSSLLKDVAPTIPVVTHCHATGLRQLALCPHLGEEVRQGCRKHDRFLVLHERHAAQLAKELRVPPARMTVVGAGYRADLFRPPEHPRRVPRLAYVGKYSHAKGLPWLLDAVERLAPELPGVELHVAGSGTGAEAEALHARMRQMAPRVVLHGMLSQEALATLLERCTVLVLPSFYEGLPLVLVEALACGCRLVATALPGVVENLEPHLGDALTLVPMPRLTDVDRPDPRDLPALVDNLADAMLAALRRGPVEPPEEALAHFTWEAVFRRVETIWQELIAGA